MQRPLMLFAIGLFFGAGVGFLVAAANGVTLTGHDHGDAAQHAGRAMSEEHDAGDAAGMHEHALLDVSGEGAPPTVALRLHPDAGSALNLEIVTGNFTFAPEAVNDAHVPGQGHAHVYVDGVKVARAYGPWFHLTDLPPDAEVRVTLNANSHETLALGNVPIAATVRAPAR